jgi:Ca2+-binding RTX toxin-like protein
VALGNSFSEGISLRGSNHTIDSNVISGHVGSGITISSGANHRIIRNLIGTQADGISALGNGRDGIQTIGTIDSSNTSIGGETVDEGNIIAFNDRHGIDIGSFGSGFSILSNSIFGNSLLGIDLSGGTQLPSGVTENDIGDDDTGANDLQNFPVISTAVSDGNNLEIGGTLNSTPNTVFRLQFFANTSLDPSGNGEGEQFIGSTFVTTDVNGDANFEEVFPTAIPTGLFVTATATSPDNNTSEFSGGKLISVTPVNNPPIADDDSTTTEEETSVTINILDGDSDPDGSIDPTTVAIADNPTNGTVIVNPDGTVDYTPDTDFSGSDSFTYTVQDNEGTSSNEARVMVTIEEAPTTTNPVIPNLVTDPLNPVSGTEGNDGLLGTSSNDLLEGLAGNDALSGEAGDDFLDGGEGIDTAVYQFDPDGVTADLEKGDNNGPATGSATDGYGNTDGLLKIENLIGSDFDDELFGDGQVNNLSGRDGNDVIFGLGGNDFIVGGAGADELEGGSGSDNFSYIMPSDGGDTINDFETGIDKIFIVGGVFQSFTSGISGGPVSSDQFFSGATASLGEHRFGYDSTTGDVLFDSDGVGGADATVLANIGANTPFTNTDITVI